MSPSLSTSGYGESITSVSRLTSAQDMGQGTSRHLTTLKNVLFRMSHVGMSLVPCPVHLSNDPLTNDLPVELVQSPVRCRRPKGIVVAYAPQQEGSQCYRRSGGAWLLRFFRPHSRLDRRHKASSPV